MPKQSVKPAPGYVLVEGLDPKVENELISGSSLELSGTNPHDQLKLGKVLDNGGPSVEARERAANIQNAGVPFGKFPEELPQSLKAGDIIAFQSLSAHALRIHGVQYGLVEYEHVLAVIKEAK